MKNDLYLQTVDSNPAHTALLQSRSVLMLQGPVGPFFDRLALWLKDKGVPLVNRVAFSGGDLWDCKALLPMRFSGALVEWPIYLQNLILTFKVDCIVLFGQARPHQAQAVRKFIVSHGITKYNLEPLSPVVWQSGGRPVLLVVGQVEDDASIRLGCTFVKTNLGLLQAVRHANPKAFIVYKPHPDVATGNRAGHLNLAQALQWADHVETHASVVSCIHACHALHTMTSLSGFDALLRGKPVSTYGLPFYAGWGLTTDLAGQGGEEPRCFARRTRRLSLDELVAGTLLRYPWYWDHQLKGVTTCMAVLLRIQTQRDTLLAQELLQHLKDGYVRRLFRKLNQLSKPFSTKL